MEGKTFSPTSGLTTSASFEDFTSKLRDQLMLTAQSTPWVSLTITIIFALTSALLMGYLLAINNTSQTNPAVVTSKVISWILYALAIILFIINLILFYPRFAYQKYLMVFIAFVQMIVGLIVLVIPKINNSIETNNHFIAFIMGIIVNGLVFLSSLTAIYNMGSLSV